MRICGVHICNNTKVHTIDKEQEFKAFMACLNVCLFSAVIFPTAWDYLQTLGVEEEYWLGFTVSGKSNKIHSKW